MVPDFINVVGDLLTQTDSDRRSNLVVDLATLTLLIDAKLVTTEQAAQRIEKIQSVLPAQYQTEDVNARLKLATVWLRSHVEQPTGQWRPVLIQGGFDQRRDDGPPQPKT
jgi:hypothetical protein